MKKKRERAAALKYVQGVDSAPRVVASGSGLVAGKIIALAKEHGIPIHEDRGLVEILSTIELNREIPQELYHAVAIILAFIYKTSRGKGSL
jgi:flagellar biosynthesis protein